MNVKECTSSCSIALLEINVDKATSFFLLPYSATHLLQQNREKKNHEYIIAEFAFQGSLIFLNTPNELSLLAFSSFQYIRYILI